MSARRVRPRLRLVLAIPLVVSLVAACDPVASQAVRHRTIAPITFRSDEPGLLALPNRPLSVKLAVIGDSGRGNRSQRDVALQMVKYRNRFSFDTVLMLGDNIYVYEGEIRPDDYRRKFEEPYRELLDAGVEFRAVLGNHDDREEVSYERFGMGGNPYYTFVRPSGIAATLAPRRAARPGVRAGQHAARRDAAGLAGTRASAVEG
jgi:hypothetical protein